MYGGCSYEGAARGEGYDVNLDGLFPLFYLIVAGVIGIAVFTGFAQRGRGGGREPVLSVAAKAVGKRTQVSHRHHHDGDGPHHSVTSSTAYYATFEVESGDRIEFRIDADEYAMLAEGDVGKLSFQGKRYIGFVRQRLMAGSL